MEEYGIEIGATMIVVGAMIFYIIAWNQDEGDEEEVKPATSH